MNVATARIANAINTNQKAAPLTTGIVTNVPSRPRTPRTTAMIHVMFFGAESFMAFSLLNSNEKMIVFPSLLVW